MLALDVLLAVLTTACIIYCMVVNRRIIQIQKYRAEMLKVFKEFDKSIGKAELILDETKKIAPKADELLESLEKRAIKQMDDIEFLLNKGDKLAEELETIIISGNKIAARMTDIQNFNFIPEDTLHHNTNDEEIEENYDLEHTAEISNEQIKLSQQDYYQIIQKKRKQKE